MLEIKVEDGNATVKMMGEIEEVLNEVGYAVESILSKIEEITGIPKQKMLADVVAYTLLSD